MGLSARGPGGPAPARRRWEGAGGARGEAAARRGPAPGAGRGARCVPGRKRRAQPRRRGEGAVKAPRIPGASPTWSRGSQGSGGGGDGRCSEGGSRHNRLLLLTGNLGRQSLRGEAGPSPRRGRPEAEARGDTGPAKGWAPRAPRGRAGRGWWGTICWPCG